MDEAINRYELLNNSLLQFVDEYCDVDNDISVNDRMTLAVFKKNYMIWCRDSGIKAMKIGKEEVEYYLGKKYGTEVVKHSNWYISNLKMKESFKKDYSFN